MAKKKTEKRTAKKKTPAAKKPKKAATSKKTSPASKKKPAAKKTKKATTFPIVGLGASAGGLEALEVFFTHMPSDSNIAFVVIQHLSPKHKSIMASLLSKCTQMTVVEMQDGMKVEPNRIYLNPPDKNVVIINGVLQLMVPVKTEGINLPIDYFFRSMAEDLAEKAICIILSGTATDGTLGLKAVKGGGHCHGPGPGVRQIRWYAQKRHRHRDCGFHPARRKVTQGTHKICERTLYCTPQENCRG